MRLRSVNGKHAPFVRPRCGFDSCRRLSTNARSSVDRALPREGSGRWFDSSRACSADVAQREEHRSATPGRPVRSGSSALEGLWCKRKHGELQPRWSGFDPWQACFFIDRRGPERLGYLGKAASTAAVQIRDPTAHHDRDVRPAAGRNGSGYRLLIDRSRVRVPPGALVLR